MSDHGIHYFLGNESLYRLEFGFRLYDVQCLRPKLSKAFFWDILGS